jgi:hypothetical protein
VHWDRDEKKSTSIFLNIFLIKKLRYSAPFSLYASAWSSKPDHHLKFRLAIGSFIEEYNNKVN